MAEEEKKETPATGEAPDDQKAKTDPPEGKGRSKKEKPDYPDDLGDKGKKALDEERKARREAEAKIKDLEPLAAKAKELEDAQKTEQQKLTEQLEAAKAEGGEASTNLLRLEVALDKAPEGTPIARVRKLAKRLTGSTREELESDADELFAEFSEEPVVPASRHQGGGDKPPQENIEKVADSIPIT